MFKDSKNITLFLLGIAGFLANGDIYSAAPLLVSISKDLNISTGEASLSIMAYMLSFGLFTLLMGPLGDRYGKTRILIVSSFGTAAFSILCVTSPNISILMMMRFAKGAFAAGIMPVSMAFLGDLFEESRRQYAIAKLMGMMTLGGASATLLGGVLSYFGSWKSVYLAYGLAEAIMALLLLSVLKKDLDTYHKSGIFKAYMNTLNNTKLFIYLIIVFMTGFSVFGSFTFAGELARRLISGNVLYIGLVLSLFGLGGLIGSKIAQKVRQRIGEYICLTAGIIGLLSLLYISYGSWIPLLCISFFGFGISFIFLHSTMIAASQSTRPHLKGTIMSLISFCIFIGSSAGTIVNKRIISGLYINAIFIISSAIFLLASIIAFIVLNMQRKQNMEYKKI